MQLPHFPLCSMYDKIRWDNGLLFCPKKDGNSGTCYNINKPWRHYAKKNKSVTKEQILYDSTYMKYVEPGEG